MKIQQRFLELWLKMSGMFFETHCSTVSELLQHIARILDTLTRFEPLFGGLRDNVRYSSSAHWKARSGLCSVNWTFFARCYGWVAKSEERSKIGDFARTRSLWSKISGTRGRPPPIILHG